MGGAVDGQSSQAPSLPPPSCPACPHTRTLPFPSPALLSSSAEPSLAWALPAPRRLTHPACWSPGDICCHKDILNVTLPVTCLRLPVEEALTCVSRGAGGHGTPQAHGPFHKGGGYKCKIVHVPGGAGQPSVPRRGNE